MSKKEKKSVESPFPESFSPVWELWKKYKKEEFKFCYKSDITERAALKHLHILSNGVEKTACDIVNQSIAHGWKGFFELKMNYNGAFTKSNTANVSDPTLIRKTGFGSI